MSKFDGFFNGKAHLTQIPEQFFVELLPLIDDVAELKVTLFVMWALQQKEGDFKYLRYDDFVESATLMEGLQILDSEGDGDAVLDCALEKCEARGTLLSTTILLNNEEVCYYVINSERGRLVIDQINSGQWRPSDAEIEILPPRPTIFALYEENIGVLQPMIIESLKDAEKEYPYQWLEEAIKHAVEANARNWKYISKILQSWKQEGRSREAVRGDSEQTNRYKSGKWADIINSE